jgi:hypothetical protein
MVVPSEKPWKNSFEAFVASVRDTLELRSPVTPPILVGLPVGFPEVKTKSFKVTLFVAAPVP